MFCPICNGENKDYTKFCVKCGNKIPRCPTCGKLIQYKASFCQEDGTRLPYALVAMLPDGPQDITQPDMEPIEKEPEVIPAPAPAPQPAPRPQPPRRDYDEPEKQGKSKTPIIILIIIIAAVAALIFGYKAIKGEFIWETFMSDSDDVEKGDQTEAPTEPATEEDTEKETQKETEKETEKQTETEKESETQQQLSYVSMSNLTRIAASSELHESGYDHSANKAIDHDLRTCWSEDAVGFGDNEYLVLTFDDTYRFSGFTIYAGYHKSEDLFNKNAAPKDLLLVFSDGSQEIVSLDKTMTAQNIYFDKMHDASEVVVYIQSVYEGTAYKDICISEIEFY